MATIFLVGVLNAHDHVIPKSSSRARMETTEGAKVARECPKCTCERSTENELCNHEKSDET